MKKETKGKGAQMNINQSFIGRLIPGFGLLIGIFATAIGSIIVLGGILKIAFLQEPHLLQGRFFVHDGTCQYEDDFFGEPFLVPPVFETAELASETTMIGSLPVESRTPRVLNKEERTKCLEEKHAQERQQFRYQQKQRIVEGIPVLLVGMIFWWMFRKK